MTNYNHQPVYNLKVVLRETGLKAELLRAWERRYELPKPQRTAGGHRLYSDFDIAVIKWLHARQIEGLSISSAVELWKEITAAGRDPLSEFSPSTSSTETDISSANIQIDLLRRDWISACMSFEVAHAEQVINRAFSLYPAESVCFELLLKGLREIGSLWAQGEVSVQQEHFATNLARRRIETLTALTPNSTRNQTILLGCPENEWHAIPLLVLNLLLKRKGFNVIYLGASTPLAQMEQTASVIHPELIILAAQQLNTVPNLQSAAFLFQKMNIPTAYGGLIFNRLPQLRERIPAIFLGENLETVPDRVEQIIARSAIPLPVKIKNNPFSDTAALFRSKLFAIEAGVTQQLKNSGVTIEFFHEVNSFIASGLSAALEMGDPAFLKPDLEWVRQLIAARAIPVNRLEQYLNAYCRAINSEMDEAGLPISNWISSYATNHF
jgi:methanogenic corrinoid protein MtbC1